MTQTKYKFSNRFANNTTQKFALLLLCCLSATACIRKLDVSLPNSATALVVNTHLTNDDAAAQSPDHLSANYSVPNVQISASADALSPQATLLDTTALVQLSANGAVVATGVYQHQVYRTNINPYFFPNFKPQPNTNYTLRIKQYGFEEVTASTTTPSAMPLFAVTHKIDSTSVQGGGGLGGGGGPGGGREKQNVFNVKISDDASTSDFYEIKIIAKHLAYNNLTGLLDTVILPNNFVRSNNTIVKANYATQTVFVADNSFNGQTSDIELITNYNYNTNTYYNPITQQYENSPVWYYTRIYKITKERYQYALSVELEQQSSGGNPFVEAAFVFSNVSSGFGIFSFGLGRTVKAVEK